LQVRTGIRKKLNIINTLKGEIALENIEQSPKMPVFFVGHGSPINAMQNNSFTRSLLKMAGRLQELPKAILVISAQCAAFICSWSSGK